MIEYNRIIVRIKKITIFKEFYRIRYDKIFFELGLEQGHSPSTFGRIRVEGGCEPKKLSFCP